MKKNKIVIWPLIVVFVILNGAFIGLRHFFERKNIETDVVIIANLLLAVLASIAILMHKKAAANPNPNAFVRSILTATVLKLFVLAGAAFIYIATAKENRSDNALFVGMALYFVYTFIEVKLALGLNKKK
jgi:hypothetical protein